LIFINNQKEGPQNCTVPETVPHAVLTRVLFSQREGGEVQVISYGASIASILRTNKEETYALHACFRGMWPVVENTNE
jgi:hypothetical protein